MLILPKWQTMWMESQHCSKSIMNLSLSSLQGKRALEDLRWNCCSPYKAVQFEALKCWGMWINHQNPDDWKLNTVCLRAVTPLIIKTVQPLHKDVDICKLKLSLMWAILVKAQNLMQLEGPQYILEVFLKSCLSWLSSCNGDSCENEISVLIFQLLLGILNKNESLTGCDREMFPPLTTDIIQLKKVFHRLADKFLNIFIHWKKVPEKKVVLKSWKYFLGQCEQSCSDILTPLWHKLFKLIGEICSEKSELVKERLAFLHSCATTLKSALSSSKFIDFGNLLTTPCEALLKKLVELCKVESEEVCDTEMFLHSKEICQVLSDLSVAIGGFDPCIGVLDVLEEFWLRDLFWGVWCGLVHCFKIRMRDIDRKHYTKPQMKFYRKLRGIAINFELDRDILHKDCVTEVEKHIDILGINCFCSARSKSEKSEEDSGTKTALEKMEVETEQSKDVIGITSSRFNETFATLQNGAKTLQSSENLNLDLIKAILKNVGLTPTKASLNCLFRFRFIKLVRHNNRVPMAIEFIKVGENPKVVCCLEGKPPSPVPETTPVKKTALVSYKRHQQIETDEETISIPRTRSRRRAEEEEKKELTSQNKKRRKTFEVLVQEIVRKNKERKNEKNTRKKSPVMTRKSKRKLEKENRGINNGLKLRKSKRKEEKKKKVKNLIKSEGKLENYFKVTTKKSAGEKEEKKSKKGKKEKKTRACCDGEKEEGKGEVGWRQTSLKTMRGREKKIKGKQEVRTQIKAKRITEEKKKGRKMTGSSLPKEMGRHLSKILRSPTSKVTGSPVSKPVRNPLSKLSPFKEVFHDHEYAKMELHKLKTYEKVFAKQGMDKKAEKRKNKCKATRPEAAKTTKTEEKIPKNYEMKQKRQKNFKRLLKKQENVFEKDRKSEQLRAKQNATQLEINVSIESDADAPKNSEVNKEGLETFEKLFEIGEKTEKPKNEPKTTQLETPTIIKSKAEIFKNSELKDEVQEADVEVQKMNALELKCEKSQEEPEISELHKKSDREREKTTLIQETKTKLPPPINGLLKNDWEKSKEDKPLEENLDGGGKKRMRMLDSLKPSKKLKLEGEEDSQKEKLPVEVIEKENLEDFQSKLVSPSKKDKSVAKVEESPKGNGMISSRVLRMIALLQDSTKEGQIQWETSSRTEVSKCKKAPNVDKSSRASKMLALLSEVEEIEEENNEETVRELTTTPNMKTPVSSMKSPMSVKKRRSIRFDDAKNETILYLTDTPPSQIFEEKEKYRRIKPTAE